MTTTLVLKALESGVNIRTTESFVAYSENDLHNIHLSRLFDASPGEFFQQYVNGPQIDSVHLRPKLLETALGFLCAHPGVTLTLSGEIGESLIRNALDNARQAGVTLCVSRTGLPRAVRLLEGDSTTPFTALEISGLSLEKAIRAGGLPQRTSAATYWNLWFKSFVAEISLCDLKVRSESQFFNVLREFSRFTAFSVNHSNVARASQVSSTTVKRWCTLFERLALIDWISPCGNDIEKRHIVAKPKFYWNAPSLAMWLMRFAYGGVERSGNAFNRLVENAVYLALKDRYASCARFGFLIDNNVREVPLIVELADVKHGFYIVSNDVSRAIARRNAKSYAKIGAIHRAYSIDASTEVRQDGRLLLSIQPLEI